MTEAKLEQLAADVAAVKKLMEEAVYMRYPELHPEERARTDERKRAEEKVDDAYDALFGKKIFRLFLAGMSLWFLWFIYVAVVMFPHPDADQWERDQIAFAMLASTMPSLLYGGVACAFLFMIARAVARYKVNGIAGMFDG